MRITTIFTLFLLILSACAPSAEIIPTPTSIATAQPPDVPALVDLPDDCGLEPIEIPSLPEVIPAYGEIDTSTGLHMTGKAQEVDFASYHLIVTGLVDNPFSITYDQLRCLPKVSDESPLACPDFFVDEAAWSGASLAEILKLAQPQAEATKIRLGSVDGYKAEVDLKQALEEWNFLAYELEGETLPVLHGFPVRAVFPGLYGSTWVKWLVEIEVK